MALKTGLIGYPSEGSLLPIIFETAYQALELDWEYRFYPCESSEEFDALITLAKDNPEEYLGFNLSAAWEDEAYKASSTRSNGVKVSQTADVMTFGRLGMKGFKSLHADTTEGSGIVRWLTDHDIDLTDSTVVIAGAGPVTFPILYSLVEARVKAVKVVTLDGAQDQEKLSALLRRFGEERYRNLMNKVEVGSVSQMTNSAKALQKQASTLPALAPTTAISYDDATEALAQAKVLIDTTAIGIHVDAALTVSTLPAQALHDGLVVIDLASSSEPTEIIKKATERGLVADDGVGILLERAAQTIEIWSKAAGLGKREDLREIMNGSVS
jgi:shikimate 5-dehydrogenase